ncbi:MAG TPA: monovalent cation/H+ antiporter subunit D [Thermodesulfobacteriota bacterium]
MSWTDHLIMLPVVVPLVAGGLALLVDDARVKAALGIASTAIVLAAAIGVLRLVDGAGAGGPAIGVYLLGNWPAPFGIVLVADRLAAVMLVLTAVLAGAALTFALARWHRAGSHFHSLFQFQVMGINGAFLTGDLFNLFVFFEVLLAASYGLALHGSGVARIRAGLHYVTVNLAASFLFLIGVSLMYGVTGTLNMADLAVRIPRLAGGDRVLLEVGAAVLGLAFLVKAAMWPLNFWLAGTYAAASPPVAALFAILTKVGVYAVLRLALLLSGGDAPPAGLLAGEWLLVGGVVTVAVGAIGAIASQTMTRLAAFNVLVSSGTTLAVIGRADPVVVGGALFYLVSSTLGIAAFFLLVELLERGRTPADDMLAVTLEAFGEADRDEVDAEDVGVAVPVTMGLLGAGFVCCAMLLAGLPPLSGFLAKFAILSALFDVRAPGAGTRVPATAWLLLATLLLSGFAILIAMMRAGVRSLWLTADREVPRVRLTELAPIALLLGLSFTLTAQAGPVMRYMQATAEGLYAPDAYVRGVLAAPPAAPGEGGGR